MKLLKLLRKYVTPQLGILETCLRKIKIAGINSETNEAIFKSGFCANTFILPQKKIVIKFFDTDKEPNLSAPDLSESQPIFAPTILHYQYFRE